MWCRARETIPFLSTKKTEETRILIFEPKTVGLNMFVWPPTKGIWCGFVRAMSFVSTVWKLGNGSRDPETYGFNYQRLRHPGRKACGVGLGRLWRLCHQLGNGKIGWCNKGARDWVRSVCLTPDGKHVVSGSWNKTICISWNPVYLLQLKQRKGWVRSMLQDHHNQLAKFFNRTPGLFRFLATKLLFYAAWCYFFFFDDKQFKKNKINKKKN